MLQTRQNRQFRNYHGIEVLNTEVPRFELGDIRTDYGEALPNHQGIYPEGHEKGDKPIAIVSDRYELINHNSVFDAIKQTITDNDYGVEGVKLTATPDYHKSFITLLFEECKEAIKVGDIVQFGCKIANGVDGRMSLWGVPFSYRLWCENGASHMEELNRIKFKHMTNVNLEDLRDTIELIISNFSQIASKYREWADTEVIEMEALDTEGKEWIAKNIPNKYTDIIVAEKPKTAWELFNVLTKSNTHDTRRNDFTKLMFNRVIANTVDLMIS
ncbi:MAG: DUF932 domain-containing protein [Candidatus Lokiarchaeota archaeon]|nr:DUF932 domain-containing protein [Candidatus Lokiarchaeota archaeon]